MTSSPWWDKDFIQEHVIKKEWLLLPSECTYSNHYYRSTPATFFPTLRIYVCHCFSELKWLFYQLNLNTANKNSNHEQKASSSGFLCLASQVHCFLDWLLEAATITDLEILFYSCCSGSCNSTWLHAPHLVTLHPLPAVTMGFS